VKIEMDAPSGDTGSGMKAVHVPVVAIGSSADGYKALAEIVRGLGVGLQAAVVIVQHRSATTRSILPKLLSRFTPLRVKDAEHRERLEPGTIYIAPAGVHITVVDGALELHYGAKVAFARPSIDVFFESVANACGRRSVGVLLGGAGRDGALGLLAMRKAGAHTLVQDPSEAVHARMPALALALNGHAVRSLGEIGLEITQLAMQLTNRAAV
jgi:two-component system chemotaxis response regulator CheB